jgi:hypothetical protein
VQPDASNRSPDGAATSHRRFDFEDEFYRLRGTNLKSTPNVIGWPLSGTRAKTVGQYALRYGRM